VARSAPEAVPRGVRRRSSRNCRDPAFVGTLAGFGWLKYGIGGVARHTGRRVWWVHQMNGIVGPLVGIAGGVASLLLSEYYIRNNQKLAETDTEPFRQHFWRTVARGERFSQTVTMAFIVACIVLLVSRVLA
jgi:hypothetical protein